MTSKLLIFLTVITFTLNSYAASLCTNILKPSTKTGTQVLYDGYMTTNKAAKRSMYVKIEKPRNKKPKKWNFLIHGLMDSHVGWNEVAQKLIDKGEGVIRVDLHGHARTLSQNYASEMRLLDATDNYRVNVTDVIQVIKKIKSDFGIVKPKLTGHSYGGGIATSIATHPFGKHLISSDLTIIAPYIYRIDGYKAENVLFYMGGLPFFKVMKSFFSTRTKAQYESLTTDPLTDVFMTQIFSKHFKELIRKRLPELSNENIRAIHDPGLRLKKQRLRRDMINQHVKAAIKITKGIRSFDGREVVNDLSPDINLQLILGEKDKLVPREMEIEFFNLLLDRDINAKLIEVEDTGHMVISESPEVISDSL